jgi:hypothetical protein
MADDKIDYITHKLDAIAEKVSDINTALEVHTAKFDAHVAYEDEQKEDIRRNTEVLHQNTSSLQDHMKRTDLLESYVKKIDDRFTPVELEILRKNAVNDFIKSRVIFLGKLGGAITALGALAAVARFLLRYLS